MRKKLIALAVAGAVAAPLAAQAADVGVSGFSDILYTISDEASDNAGLDVDGNPANTTEGKFSMDSEVDFMASEGNVSARVDIDLELARNGNVSLTGESGRIEQAFAAWNINDAVSLLGGVMNNPLGLEGEDAPSLWTTSHGQIYNILDNQTFLDGNNVVGAVAAFGLGMVDVTAGIVNDLQQANEETSFVVAASASPVENLNVEAGFVTQADNHPTFNPGSGENIFDINGTYKWNNILVGAEYLGAGALVDSAYGLFGNVEVGNGFGGTVRWDTVSYDSVTMPGQGDTSELTLTGTYAPSENLSLLLEYVDKTDDTVSAVNNDFSMVTFEIVATLGDYKD